MGHTTDFAEYLLRISVTDYRKIRKAVQTLVRAGVTIDNAISTVVVAHMDRMARYDRPREVAR